MARVQVLPDAVARRIAAGEVIERPVSVVKELVENSLDAGARRIVVEVDGGGVDRIAVTDDGEGMAAEDLPLAFRPHATSKIRTEEDLLQIATLGFRGEALPSIAAVADVEVWTRRAADASGAHLHLRGGELVGGGVTGAPAGCRIEVRELFFNTPARRKFLKSAQTESGHVAQLLGRIALAAPETEFRLVQNGREALRCPAEGRQERIARILGRELANELRPVDADGPIAVGGFASHPHFTLPSQRAIHFFVNGRFVRDRTLTHALFSAYATLVPHGRSPAAVLFLRLAPDEVDVNVHPAKLEVRFRSSAAVHEAIGRAVRRAVVAPATEAMAEVREPIAAWSAATAASEPSRASGGGARLRLVPVETATAAEPLRSAALLPPRGRFASLRVLGQVFDGYLVCEGEGELVVIDQHAAHERVRFERLREQRCEGAVAQQALLVPQTIELAPGGAELLAGSADALAKAGLELEAFGDRAVVVRAVPAALAPSAVDGLVRALAAELGEVGDSRALDEEIEGMLATVACHSAVRVGERLDEREIRALLTSMDEIDLATNCPHGRPVARAFPRGEIERLFGR